MLSAKSRSSSFLVNFHLNPASSSFVVFLITKSNTNKKRKPDIEHPCFTSVFTSNHSDSSPSSMTAHCVCLFEINKFMYSPACHSTDCSMMFHKMKSCSIVLLPSLKPACSFLSSLSTPSSMRFISSPSIVSVMFGSHMQHTSRHVQI